MKITLENNSRMVLKDHNYTSFVVGIVFFLAGLGVSAIFSNGNLLIVGFGLIFALVGLYAFVSAKIVTITLDKAAAKANFSFQSVINRQNRDVEIGKIKEIILQKTISNSGKSTSYVFILKFGLEGGEEIPVEFATLSASIVDVVTSPDEKVKKDAKQITDFLGVNFRYEGPPSVADLMSAVKDGIAKGMENQGKGTVQ
jgi:hypothetical protein